MSLVGRHIGRYRILEQLGQGGMSVVYKGLDTALDREVAVKVLHAHLAGKEESRKRLAREAKAVARLHHPNILEVYDFAAQDAEQAYIVTEYIRGQTLRHYVETMGFEPPEIAALVVHEVASALAQAHEAGVIHRDLKPENVMVRDDGVVKLMDFGIAKIIDRDDRMTQTGALVGSPAHMAPEIIEGEEAGPEADVFSLGTMLYQFATGRLPFVASNTTATLKKILDGVYDDPRQLVPTVSDDLAEIIATCLARQPSSRYADASRLEEALHGYLEKLGLGRTKEEVQHFFADPTGYRKALKPRLCGALVSRSEALLAEKRPARALGALNQVLALDPQHARALELLAQMNAARKRQQRTQAWKQRAVWGAAGVALIAVITAVGIWIAQRPTVADEGESVAVAPSEPAVLVTAPAENTKPPEPPSQPVQPPVEPVVTPVVESVKPPKKPQTVAAAAQTQAQTQVRQNPAVAAVVGSGLPRPTGPTGPGGPTGPKPVDVTIILRPFGFLMIDGKRIGETEMPRHKVSLLPGEHLVSVGCNGCNTTEEKITVAEGETDPVIHIFVEPKPATLTFEVHPRDARVTVRGETRTVAETAVRPFEIRAPRSQTTLQHRVTYEISHPDYQTRRGKLELGPGETKIETGALTLDRP